MNIWKQNLAFVGLSQFLSIAGFSLALPFIPFYVQELGITNPASIKLWSAISMSCSGIGLAVSSPVWGTLSDRYGRKLMMLRANFGAVIILAGMGFAPNVQVFVFLRLMQGLFTGTMNAAMTFVATSAPYEKQGMAIGSLSAAIFSGGMIGPLAGGFLADIYGYRITFILSAFLLLISALIILFNVQEKFTKPVLSNRKQATGWRNRIAASGQGIPILFLIFLTAVARKFDQPVLPLYIQDLHGSLTGASRWTGAINGVGAIGAMMAGIILGRLSDKISPQLIGRLSALGGGIFFALMGFSPLLLYLFPIRFFLTFCGGGLDPVFQIWLSRVTPESKRGTIFGWSVTAKSIGWAIAPLLSGGIAVTYGIKAVYFTGPFLFWLLIWLIPFASKKVLALREIEKNELYK